MRHLTRRPGSGYAGRRGPFPLGSDQQRERVFLEPQDVCCQQGRARRKVISASNRKGETGVQRRRMDWLRSSGSSTALKSRMGWAILFEVRIARSGSGYENCCGLIICEREVGRVRRFCIERALRKHARLSLVGLAAISKVPFA